MRTGIGRPSPLLLLGLLVSLVMGEAKAENNGATAKRPITVADSISMSLAGDPLSEDRGGDPAIFSPDGKSFVVVIRKGNIESNVVDYSLLLFHSAELWNSSRIGTLVTFSSGSNRPGIEGVCWLDDRRIAFSGENSKGVAQLYVLFPDGRKMQKVTDHPTALAAFGLRSDGQTIAFLAWPPIESFLDEKSLKYFVPEATLYLVGDQYPGGMAFNHAAFVNPTTGQQGNFPRNKLRGFAVWQDDFAVHCQFRFSDKLGLQFRAELFNVFNHPNFGSPTNSLTSPLFGLSTQTLASSFCAGGTKWRIQSLVSDWRAAFDPTSAEIYILTADA